jgi:hypothetical protein
MSCQDFSEQFALYLYGELAPAAEEALESHCASCEPCRAALEQERVLHRSIDGAEMEVPDLLLASCRRELSQQLMAAPALRRGLGGRLQDWFGSAVNWKPALAACALLACGFFAGRLGQRPAETDLAPENLLTRVRDVNSDGQGQVRLVLEETRQRTVGGSLDDDRIRQLVLAAAQDPADAGVRFESVDVLRRHPAAADVQRALMSALSRDPNPGVRLKALEGLKLYAGDPLVRRLFADTLERDDNPGVRTQAVDLLIQHGQKDVVDVLQRLMQREENGYIRSRSQRALEAINASVETF